MKTLFPIELDCLSFKKDAIKSTKGNNLYTFFGYLKDTSVPIECPCVFQIERLETIFGLSAKEAKSLIKK
jgi:hypothetical protein